MDRITLIVALLCLSPGAAAKEEAKLPYPIVDTGQVRCYDDRREIGYPEAGKPWFGQDARYRGNQPSYRDNGEDTVTDLVTGLTWTADPGKKMTLDQAVQGAAKCRTGLYADWRLPTIKELYSLILFSGTDPDPRSEDRTGPTPFIDRKFFKFRYGREEDGDRIIDSQFASSKKYVSTTMDGQTTVFGVNFADGRIKGYGLKSPRGRGQKTFYVLYVRGNPRYGKNDFVDNKDGTVTDRATGLTWMKVDSAALKAGEAKDGKLNWPEALAWAEGLTYAGHRDWRLPNAKELQSIVDYTRSPDATKSAAIDPVFAATPIENEGGAKDWAHYWTSTTHVGTHSARAAVYVSFGRGLGFLSARGPRSGSGKELMDVHGAGSQRSDDKDGAPDSYPQGRGPQGDVVRIENLVRCVRGGKAVVRAGGPELEKRSWSDPEPGGGPGGRPGEGPPSGANFVRRLDKDGDGRVSKAEFDGPAEHFGRFDRNGDGFISGDEAPTGPPPRRR